MDAVLNTRKYLIREELGGSVMLSPASNGLRLQSKSGARYQILSSLTFKNIQIHEAYKEGQDLIVILLSGERIVFENYFVNDLSNDSNSRAAFSQVLPLQLNSLDHNQEADETGQVYPQTNPTAVWPQQGYYPPPPHAYREDDGWGDNLLGLGGIILGGLALGLSGLRDSSSGMITNNVTGGSGGGGGGGGSSSSGGASGGAPGVAAENNAVSVKSVSIDSDRSYFTTDETIPFLVTFTDIVNSTTPDDIEFEFNDGDYVAVYKDGIGTNVLSFELKPPSITTITSLSLGAAPLNLNGASLLDKNNFDVEITPFPDWSEAVFLEPQPEIINITASPVEGEFFDPTDIDKEIVFYVQFDRPVQYDGSNLNLVLNTGDTGAVYTDQIGKDGLEDKTILRFEYSLVGGVDANDAKRELLPLAFNENGGEKVQSVNGSSALVQITEEITRSFKDDHEILFDLDQPKIADFAVSQLTTDGETIERDFGGSVGLKTLLKVNGVVDIEYTEGVTTNYNDGTPALAIEGLYIDAGEAVEPALGKALYDDTLTSSDPILSTVQKYSFEDLYVVVENPTTTSNQVNLVAVGGLMENMATIVGEAGVPASDQLPADKDIGVITISNESNIYSVSVGAGPFIANSIEIIIDDFDLANGSFYIPNKNWEESLTIAVAADINGALVNYVDEFTGEFKDLSEDAISNNRSLRAILSDEQMAQDVFITPLSELHVRAVEMSDDSSDHSVAQIKKSIANFFGLSDFVFTKPSFVNQTDEHGELINPNDPEIAVALAVLSTMDAVSGSVWDTIEILSPVFSGSATEQNVETAIELASSAASLVSSSTAPGYVDHGQQIMSVFQKITQELDNYNVNNLDHKIELFEDISINEFSYMLDDVKLNDFAPQDGYIQNLNEELRDIDDTNLNSGNWATNIDYKEWEFD